jgi:hypothetical protein
VNRYLLHGNFGPRVIFLVVCQVTTIEGRPFQPLAQSLMRENFGVGADGSHKGKPVRKEIWYSHAECAGKSSHFSACL